ncbi:MAG: hypothetical protein M1838_004853 [Thelocarpon superellum]|nr:MAG: hypothetical protein M1838_004853 [Thelocarpon superellum]
MYLQRSLFSHLYLHLLRTHHPLSPPVLVLVALEPDALCGCRILTALLKRDYIPHKIQPVAGYGDLASLGERLVRPMRTSDGGTGGIVVCLGLGGLVDLSAILGLDRAEEGDDAMGGVEVWVMDARRPWNLGNVFGGRPASPITDESIVRTETPGVQNGRVLKTYQPGRGGIFVFDDGDIDDELAAERDAYCALEQMPDVDDDGRSDTSDTSSSGSEDEQGPNLSSTRKRKSWSDADGDANEDEDDDRPRRRRRTNSSGSLPVSKAPSRSISPVAPTSGQTTTPRAPSARRLRRQLMRLRRKHEDVLRRYYELGNSYAEPVSALMYSLASELGREDNDLLWWAIVGVSSLELYGRSMMGVSITQTEANELGGAAGWGGRRGEAMRQLLRDEVRRLNPPELTDVGREMNRGEMAGIIPTHARSPADTSIRLSPEPRFLLIRHWSLYDSMLHSPYLSARLHIWSDAGRRRLHKLLAKMGVSLTQCKQSYTHMDMELKRGLRASLLKYAPLYGLTGLVPPEASVQHGRQGWGFVRNWGFKACLSATDVGVVVGAILEVGRSGVVGFDEGASWDGRADERALVDEEGTAEGEEWVGRFWEAYDALDNIDALKAALPTAMHLHRAILRTGTSLIEKRQIRHLRAFRMSVVKEGPDVQLFTHPAALTKLALWVGEAIAEQEKEQKGRLGKHGRGTPLVMAGLNERRGVYVVVGTGGGGGTVDLVGQRERKAQREKKKTEREARQAAKELQKRERAARREAAGEEDEATEEEEESSEDEDEDEDADEDGMDAAARRSCGRNRFGNAFQEVVDETKARVRIDSFEHCVVEVKKEDLTGFLETLSMKAVVG